MSTTITVEGGEIYVYLLDGHVSPGDKKTVVFKIPSAEGVNLGNLSYRIKLISDSTGVSVVASGTAQTDGEYILVTWEITNSTIRTAGIYRLELIGVDALGDTRYNAVSDPFEVLENTSAEMYRTSNVAAYSARLADPATEPMITVNGRKTIIPDALKKIAVEGDENSETVYVSLPRYFDGIDRAEYDIYLRTVHEIGGMDEVIFNTKEVGEENMILAWTLKPPQTSYGGTLEIQFIVRGTEYEWSTYAEKVIIARRIGGKPFAPPDSDVYDKWLEEVEALAESAETAAAEAKASADSIVSTAEVVNASGAGAHNAIYRGKWLGEAPPTAEQYAAIAAGTFEDLYIGDYWTKGGITYRIAAFDYYYNTGDATCTEYHVTIVPDKNLYNHVMNDTNTTDGAYVGSKMYTEGLTQAKTTINSAFGEAHVLKHRQYLQNAATDGYASAASWYDSTVELMTEQNVYGCKILGNVSNGTALPNNYTVDKSQYPLFAFRPDMISNRAWFWLRDVVSAARFADVGHSGGASSNAASSASGVRPAFSIIG